MEFFWLIYRGEDDVGGGCRRSWLSWVVTRIECGEDEDEDGCGILPFYTYYLQVITMVSMWLIG